MALQSATNGPDDSNSKSKDLDVGTTTCWCVLSIRMATLRLSTKSRKKKKKITAQSIPMWSPTIVLTLPSGFNYLSTPVDI